MRKIFILIGITICANILNAQVVTTKPVVPTLNKAIEVTFDASKGTKGLMGYSGTVYAHTGVITDKSTSDNDWKYVVTEWGENDSKVQLTNIGGDLWKFTITPNIPSFYGVPDDEQVLKLAFVFRSAEAEGALYLEGKDDGGKDILIDVSEDDFNLIMLSPKGNTVYAPNSSISVSAAASDKCKLSLYSNGALLKELAADTLIGHVMNSVPTGEYSIVAVAELGSKIKSDTVNVTVRAQTESSARPSFVQNYDGIYYHPDDNTKVTLVLCAPQKDHVFVWGDFTDWKMRNKYQMKKDGDRFWITIENLMPGLEYAFQYVVDDSIYVADPYSEKVLDSWNDPYISVNTYPNLKSFPKVTEGYASVIETGQEPYNWVVTDFAAPRNEDLVIYELLLRDFLKAHNYATLIDTLSYLQRLGINAIELLPINEFDGNESWGYNSAYYCSPDKYYGSAKSLKRFIDECHRRGIAVIIDIALNHSFGNSPTAKMYWDATANKPTANSPYHNRDAKHPFNVGEDFNHDSPYTQYLVKRVVEYWLKEYNIDGYRFDLSKGFTQNYTTDVGDWNRYDGTRVTTWKRISGYVWNVKPNAYVILEHLGETQEENELASAGMMLWKNMEPNYAELAMGWSSGKANISGAHSSLDKNKTIAYMESHDEERIVRKLLWDGNEVPGYSTKNLNTALQRVAMAATLFYTVPGPKMLWQFGELGYDYSINYCNDTLIHEDCRTNSRPIRWDYMNNPKRMELYNVFSKLIHLKKNYPAIKNPSQFYIGSANSNDNSLLKWTHADKGDSSLVALVNADVVQQSFDVYFPREGRWYEYFTGNTITVGGDKKYYFTLAPGEYQVYTSVPFSSTPPEIVDPPSLYPSVSITHPENNAEYILGNNVTVNVSASNNDSLHLYYNNTLVQSIKGNAINFTVENITPIGIHEFKARANNTQDEDWTAIQVVVRELNKESDPWVSITSPGDNVSYIMGSNITISMSAGNNDSIILYHNGVAVLRTEGTEVDFPVNDIVPAGIHRFVAEAKSISGLASVDSISLNILPPELGIITNTIEQRAKVGDDVIVDVNVSHADSIILQHNNTIVIRKYGTSVKYIIKSVSGIGPHVFVATAKSKHYNQLSSRHQITVYKEAATSADKELQSRVKIYPNPFNTEIRIESEVSITSVDFIRSNGEMMQSLVFPQIQGVATINTNTLPVGNYFIRIVTDKGVVVRQVVKK